MSETATLHKPLEFWVNGEPVGQPRPRACIRRGRVHIYDPGTAEAWKSQVAIAARGLFREKLQGPIWLRLEFFFPRPKSHFRTGKHAETLRDDAPDFHTIKPDSDNCHKAVMDALTQLGAWHDDAQVAFAVISKRYGAQPGCRVIIADARTL